MNRLDDFEKALAAANMANVAPLINIACSVKSRARTITYTRSDRDDALHFQILGGSDLRTPGIFINAVDVDSQAEKIGLKRGDEILTVNNVNFQV